MLTLHLATADFVPLAGSPHQLIIAQNGLFLAKENPVYRAIVRQPWGVDPTLFPVGMDSPFRGVQFDGKSHELTTVVAGLTLKLRLPFSQFCRAIAFFRHAFETHGVEAFLGSSSI